MPTPYIPNKYTIAILFLVTHTLRAQQGDSLTIIRFTQDTVLTESMDVSSNTYITCDSGVWVKASEKLGRRAIILKHVENVIFENFNLDINANRNFIAGIYAISSQNITVKRCHFKNSRDTIACKEWTLLATSFRDVNDIEVIHNQSYGCQFKLAGANGGAENVIFRHNYVEKCTQMGVSVVVNSTERRTSLKNIRIEDNIFRWIDNYAVYVGIDSGKGHYDYTTKIEDIFILSNRIDTLSFMEGIGRGILFRGTKDTKNIYIQDNLIRGKQSSHSTGIDMKNADGSICMQNILITDNTILNFRRYAMRISGIENFTISNNQIGDCGVSGGIGIKIGATSKNGFIKSNSFYNTESGIQNEGTEILETHNLFSKNCTEVEQ